MELGVLEWSAVEFGLDFRFVRYDRGRGIRFHLRCDGLSIVVIVIRFSLTGVIRSAGLDRALLAATRHGRWRLWWWCWVKARFHATSR